MTEFTGFFWFVALLVPLIFLQRLLHREIQAVFLILSRDARLTIVLFQIIFLPGVFLHELSHFLTAKLLRVRTGGFSVIPRALPNGRLQLGYVETARADVVRESLIGAAPLVAAMDDTLLRKTGTKIQDVAYRRDPLSPPFHVNFVRGQRFLQVSAMLPACPEGPAAARAIPIRFQPAPPLPKATKAAGAWEITEAGNTRKYPWAAGLPAGAAFSINQDADGTVTFVAEDNCSGIFRGARKRMTDIGAGVSKLRQFHDGKDVTADSFRLSAILDGKTFIFSGYRKKSKKGAAQDTGVIEIFSATRSFLTELKSPTVAVRALQHGGPHGEPRKSLAKVTPDGGETHKLVGRWRIREPGGSAYPWSSGLPVDARFEITSDLKFVPGKGCTGKFRRAKKLKRPPFKFKKIPGSDMRELVTPECGVLVPHGTEAEDVERYTQALSELLAQPERRLAMGAAARARVQAYFQLEHMVDGMVGLFGQARQRCAEPFVVYELGHSPKVSSALQAAGFQITLIKDVTPIPHNGCRQPKRRRV